MKFFAKVSLMISLIFVLTACSESLGNDLLSKYRAFQDEEGGKIERYMREDSNGKLSTWWSNFRKGFESLGQLFRDKFVLLYEGSLEVFVGKVFPWGESSWRLAKDKLARIFNRYPNILEKIKYGTE